jgi:SAM-dependent methyltransferase
VTQHHQRQPAPATRQLDTSWDEVAEWYDSLVDERGSDYQREVVIPGALRLLGSVGNRRILDVACGQGVLCRELRRLGARVTGIDASSALIEQARRREVPGKGSRIRYCVMDARALGESAPESSAAEYGPPYDAACCVLSIQNIDPIAPVFAGVARVLGTGAEFVIVMLHPAFRAIGQTSWGWDAESGRQFRRVDGYLTPYESAVRMRPGADPKLSTLTFHRPLQTYVQQLALAGLVVDGLQEWPSHRRSPPSPRAAEEDRARREIPMFLGLRAFKR